MAVDAQVKVREVIHAIDVKHYSFECYETRKGKKAETMQIDYAKD